MSYTTLRKLIVPKPFKALLHRSGLGIILHCPGPLPILQTLVMLAIATPVPVRAIVVLEPKPALHVARLVLDTGRTNWHANGIEIVLDRGESIWIVPSWQCLPEDAEAVFAADCDQLPEPSVVPANGVFAGRMGERGTWFSRLAIEATADVVLLDREQAIKAFPKMARLPHAQHADHDRACLLRDVALNHLPFGRWARERLRIRTAKGAAFLSPEQIAEVRAKYGDGWSPKSEPPIVTYIETPLQRRYRANVRLGMARGFRRFILVKYRRGGFTSQIQAQNYRLACITPGVHTACYAHKLEPAQRIFRAVAEFHERDPQRPALITDSKTQLQFANGSTLFVGTAGGKGASRGEAIRRFHGSEVAHWCPGPRQNDDVDALMAGISSAAEGGVIELESTPAGRNWFFQTYRDAPGNGYWPIFLPWFLDRGNVSAPGTFSEVEIRETLTDSEKDLIARHGLGLAQIAWRRGQQKALRKLFAQEYPEDPSSCFLTSGIRFFDVDTILAHTPAATKSPIAIEAIPGGVISYREKPQPGVRYVGGADPSEGIPGCDPSALYILRADTGKPVAWVHGYFRPSTLAGLIKRLSVEYHGALMGVERENHGHAVLTELENLNYSRSHWLGGPIYYFGATADTARPGWNTSPQTRPTMLNALFDFVEGAIVGTEFDPAFLEETGDFGLQSSGRYEHDPGCHDDRVIAMAVANQMRLLRPMATMPVGINIGRRVT